MEEKEFVALVDQLEDFARSNPGQYKVRVALLAALGYVFLVGSVIAVLVLVIAIIASVRVNILLIKILLIPLGVAVVVLRSLWVEFPEPEGQPLRYDNAPRLFDLAKSLREATNGPTLHKILLTDAFNAAIVQRPRLGVFGWQENYLIVGLPLLRGLTPDEVKAVLAHEFGHLSGKHGAFSAWIYRVRQTWDQVLTRLREENRFGSGIFESFFKWYSPYFNAYSFVLARSREYEADRSSALLCGQETVARTLIKLELKAKALSDEYWPAFFMRADKETEPPKETFTEMLNAIRQPLTPDKAQTWFSQSLSLKHSYADTHPALGDRLEALGYTDVRTAADLKPFLKDEDQCGDEYFLQSVPDNFIASTNRAWREEVVQNWRERNKFIAEADKTLAALEEKAKKEELTLDERWERARLLCGKEGPAAALSLLQEIVAADPEHASANYALGEALLETGDEAGIRHIEFAMEKQAHAIPMGCELIYEFLTARKRVDEAERYRQCIVDYYKEAQAAQDERFNVSTKDSFRYHELPPEMIRELREQLKHYPNLATAHLVQKVVYHFPEEPSYVLGVTGKRPWYRSQSNARDQALVNVLAEHISFPGPTMIIALEQSYRPLRKVFAQIQGSEIYRAAS